MIVLENVSKTYDGRVALAPTTLDFAARRTTVLIGPTGCGKSTLLRMIVGLIAPDTGRVVVDGTPLRAGNILEVRRRIGYVIQEGGLFPHLTAAANVALLARHLGREEDWIAPRLRELGDLVQMPLPLLGCYPDALSGGQRQRVSLMRALVLDPPILLMDEPLGALDPVTRYDLQDELKRIFGALAKTVVLVTHDMSEAAHFGDTVILMREGRVLQEGPFAELLHRPANDYVRRYLRAHRPILPVPGI